MQEGIKLNWLLLNFAKDDTIKFEMVYFYKQRVHLNMQLVDK